MTTTTNTLHIPSGALRARVLGLLDVLGRVPLAVVQLLFRLAIAGYHDNRNRPFALKRFGAQLPKTPSMPTSDKDRSADVVVQRWLDFQNALSGTKKYPVQQFKSFVDAARRYIELSKDDPLIHRNVAKAINGLTDFLGRKGSASPVTSSAKRSVWNAFFSAATIRTSRAMSPLGCKTVGSQRR